MAQGIFIGITIGFLGSIVLLALAGVMFAYIAKMGLLDDALEADYVSLCAGLNPRAVSGPKST